MGDCKSLKIKNAILVTHTHNTNEKNMKGLVGGPPVGGRPGAEARALEFFFTKGDNIKSCQMDDKSPLKGAWFCSRDAFLYAQLWT